MLETEALELLVGRVPGVLVQRVEHVLERDPGGLGRDGRARELELVGGRRDRLRHVRQREAVLRDLGLLVALGQFGQRHQGERPRVRERALGHLELLDRRQLEAGHDVLRDHLQEIQERAAARQDLHVAVEPVAPRRRPVGLAGGRHRAPREDRPHARQHRPSAPVAPRLMVDAAGVGERVRAVLVAVRGHRDVVHVDAGQARVLPARAVVDVEADVLVAAGRAQAAGVAGRELDDERRLEPVQPRAVGDARELLVGRVELLRGDDREVAELGRGPEVVRIGREQRAEPRARGLHHPGGFGCGHDCRHLRGRGTDPSLPLQTARAGAVIQRTTPGSTPGARARRPRCRGWGSRGRARAAATRRARRAASSAPGSASSGPGRRRSGSRSRRRSRST